MPSAKSSKPATPVPLAPDALAEIVALLAAHERKIDALLNVITPIVTRRLTTAQQARAAGVSRTTLWRRRQQAKLQLALPSASRRVA